MSAAGPDVLVVGAGPTGLALALQAVAHGARVRVVEQRPDAFRPSKALIVHPRTLEVLRPLGVTGALLARGDTDPAVDLHLGHRVLRVALAELPLPGTAFPHLLLVRQADVEAVLARALADRGVAVERGTTFTGGASASDLAVATLERGGAREEVVTRFLVGGDGAASAVRRAAGLGFAGRAYHQDVVLADVELDGDLAPGVAHVAAGREGLLFLFALGELAPWRLLATEPAAPSDAPFGQPGPPVPQQRLQQLVDAAGLPARITAVAWSGRVRLQHRLAPRFRSGPVLLAGDAAHTHSPAGGQGMNTGLQDATNLGWKLALAARCPPAEADALLRSYDAERRPVARRVLALTHAVFWAEAGTGRVPSTVRSQLVPLAAPLVPLLLRQQRLVGAGFGVLSQLRWHYRRSPLSVGAGPGPGPRAGDRLPDREVVVAGGRCRLHALTDRPGLHVLLSRDAPPLAGPWQLVHVHRLLDAPGSECAVVRPDGHVGYRGDVAGAAAWLRSVGVR